MNPAEELYAEAVEGLRPALPDLLADVARFVRRFVVFPSDAQPRALALWTAHAHAIEAADVTPYVAVTSPAKRSAKTLLLECLELLVPRPLRTANISDAALFRIIDEGRPTILLDEADVVFRPKSEREDLRALLNAGYRRGAEVVRCEANGRAQVVRRFDAFAAKALAAIGNLPDTVSDRAIPIRLKRRARTEVVERFRFRDASNAAAPIRARLETWAAGAVEELRGSRPELPKELHDRAQDGWEPLLAIADAAGGDWPAAARAAAIELHATDAGEPERGVELLRDLRAVFDEGGADRFASAEVVRRLNRLDESPWGGWPLDQRGLARLLRPYGVRPSAIRLPDGTTPRGYKRGDLEDAFARYLPGTATSATSATLQVAPTRDVADVADVALIPGVSERGSPPPFAGGYPKPGYPCSECGGHVGHTIHCPRSPFRVVSGGRP